MSDSVVVLSFDETPVFFVFFKIEFIILDESKEEKELFFVNYVKLEIITFYLKGLNYLKDLVSDCQSLISTRYDRITLTSTI